MTPSPDGGPLPSWFDQYLNRIGWDSSPVSPQSGKSPAARAILAAIVAKHAGSIAFENLDPFLHLPVNTSEADVIDKLVTRKRGGYCFEQNILLKSVLTSLGYTVEPVMARVVWANPNPAENARSHMALKVELAEDGDVAPVIVDVGFGGNVLTGVLDLISDVPQATPHGFFKLVERDDGWMQSVQIAGEWRETYLFTLSQVHPIDITQANWWVSTYPDSHFRHQLSAAISPPGQRIAMRNHHFTTYYNDGEKVEETISSVEAVERLSTHFGISHTDPDALAAKLEGLNT